MGIKRKKGFGIATKSLKSKLSREGFSFLETKNFFNEVVEFYFMVINTYESGLFSPEQRLKEKSGKPKTPNMPLRSIDYLGWLSLPFSLF
jgi:hypothetical protein